MDAKETQMARGIDYDVVYYWIGGTENGRWQAAEPGVYPEYLTVNELVAQIERGGRVAVRGIRRIGPPEGPPSHERLAEAGA